ncbi:MAG: hypothetical protein FWC97_01630 [Treponema sp.]|nr:hypothetical protein [Treponema sp.]
MKEIYCYKCDIPKDEQWKGLDEKIMSACRVCRKVSKAELMNELMRLNEQINNEKVYLSESNRNKNGRPPTLTKDDKEKIRADYLADPKKNSYSKLAYKYGVSKGTISNAINKHECCSTILFLND